MKRRVFIAGLGSAAVWPVVTRAQQPAIPVIGFVSAGSADAEVHYVAAFRKGLSETGYVEGQNVTVEHHWLEGQFDRLPGLMADLVRRRVAVIATGTAAAAIEAKGATATIPIVFGVGDDPIRLGIVTSLARPGGNVTGVNFFAREVNSKRLAILYELVPKAARIAVLVNPGNPTIAEATLRDVQEGARVIGLQVHVLKASKIGEIDAAFATFAAHHRIPAAYSIRDYVAVGGLMSYGTDVADRFRQTGVYAGKILNGANPDNS